MCTTLWRKLITSGGKCNGNWSDEVITRKKYENEPLHVLENIPDWLVDKQTGHVKDGGCILTVYAPNPDLLDGIEPERIAKANKAAGEALSEYREYMMSDRIQWSIVSFYRKMGRKNIPR